MFGLNHEFAIFLGKTAKRKHTQREKKRAFVCTMYIEHCVCTIFLTDFPMDIQSANDKSYVLQL